MNLLVLFDNRGQCQRVANVPDNQVQAFLDAGFVIVDEAEFNRCAALVPEATIADLENIRIATRLVNQIETAVRVQPAPPPPVRQAVLNNMIARQQERFRAITQDFIDGDATMAQWFRQFVDAINQGNLAATALGTGGLENITQQERQALERANEAQASFVVRFQRVLESEQISNAEALARAQLYGGAVTERYWTAHTRTFGIQLPAMPGVRTSCRSNCKCNWNIIPLAGVQNFDCFWRISAVENCPECLQRQRTFDPLEIRNGIVQPFNPGGIYV
jgi:hypothetical protein